MRCAGVVQVTPSHGTQLVWRDESAGVECFKVRCAGVVQVTPSHGTQLVWRDESAGVECFKVRCAGVVQVTPSHGTQLVWRDESAGVECFKVRWAGVVQVPHHMEQGEECDGEGGEEEAEAQREGHNSHRYQDSTERFLLQLLCPTSR